jgi:hypothetical protein
MYGIELPGIFQDVMHFSAGDLFTAALHAAGFHYHNIFQGMTEMRSQVEQGKGYTDQ